MRGDVATFVVAWMVAAVAGFGVTADALASTPHDWCGYRPPAYWQAVAAGGVVRGDEPSIDIRAPGPAMLQDLGAPGPVMQCLPQAHVFPYEDTDALMLSFFTEAQLQEFMVQAANAVIATHGDEFDFIGFWTNFDPAILFGSAFYMPVANDVEGIGDPGVVNGVDGQFDLHGVLGLEGVRVEGMVMMWNVNSVNIEPGDGAAAALTRLRLGHEFLHRFGVFLPELAGGRAMQGDNDDCGHAYHWNRRLDGQGSAIEMSEWIGATPAVRMNAVASFNADTGGVYSYTDLYLMGYVSRQEMDAGNSELRYMEDDCDSPYFGPITAIDSMDIRLAAGVRQPNVQMSQKHYKTAWIMIHQPDDPPSSSELEKTTRVLEQHVIDWHLSTLGRGTMDHVLFPDCNCNGEPDDDDIESRRSRDDDGDGVPDECPVAPCPADIDYDRTVGFLDMLAIFSAWGACGYCPEDLDLNGVVGFLDLAVLLAQWGPCG